MSEPDLMRPESATKPLSPANWRLRLMAMEYPRRARVLEGRKDPTPFEPWRVCDPKELLVWMENHPSKFG